MVVEAIRFDMVAGTTPRRVFLHELHEWLQEHVGFGRFILEQEDKSPEPYDWYIVTANDYIKVLLTKERDVTMFMLRWG